MTTQTKVSHNRRKKSDRYKCYSDFNKAYCAEIELAYREYKVAIDKIDAKYNDLSRSFFEGKVP
jgi:hypothetical protein